MEISTETLSGVQEVLAKHAELKNNITTLSSDDDLFAAGMSSRATVGVMLGLESKFDVEFPDNMLRRDVFESTHSIATAVQTLLNR